ncbi:hypothetical protein [Parvibaculum sp.]|uniref:hypothetical protein n=1 Tax=Parvibaculum sp. TaxID=2024848 RepID=UPI001DD41293|nr:hypothetical protein [Parvibaculum sp.]MBX3488904.1 hypothetical protein [Parvibaculum sp.]
MTIKLETTQVQHEHIAACANGRGRTVRVDREALMNLMIDHTRLRKGYGPKEISTPEDGICKATC